MLKITAKTTKEQLMKILGANAKVVKEQDKDLFDRLAYTDKMVKKDANKVTRKDLVDLVKEVATLLGDALINPLTPQATPVAENATKKLKGAKKTETPKEESSEVGESEEEEPQETPAETPKAEAKGAEKKSAKKSSLGKKKDEPKKDGATASSTKKTVQNKAFVLAEVFPETFEIEGNKYEIAKDISNMGQLQDAVNDGEPIVFAMYWTKRHLRQFEYVGDLKAPKEFPLDLDLATCLFVAEDSTVAYAISAYTNVCYMYLPDDIEESDGLRFSKGIEYQIYRMVE